MKRMRRNKRWMRRLAVMTSGAMLAVGACTGNIGTTFRTAAANDLEAGVLSIVTGVVGGVFAVINPDEVTDATN